MDQARIVRLTSGFSTSFELLRTAYESQSFARHTHETYTLGLVLGGAGRFWCHGAERFAAAGDLVVIPPGEVHTGSVATGAHRLSYLAVYLPVGLAALHADAAGLRGGNPPEFDLFVLRDPVVRRAYQALDRTIGSATAFRHAHPAVIAGAALDHPEAAAKEAACLAITALIRRHALRDVPADALCNDHPGGHEPHVVSVVREVIEQCYATPARTSLEALATETDANPFHVIRTFRQVTGLTPHQYLIQVRVMRARQFLAEGDGPSLAALRAGFVDQSHLTYHFKKRLGITPGSYHRSIFSKLPAERVR